MVSSGVRDVTLVTHICSHSAECLLFSIKKKQLNLVLWCTTKSRNVMRNKMGFYLQGQGHSVGLYNQNMTVSTIFY